MKRQPEFLPISITPPSSNINLALSIIEKEKSYKKDFYKVLEGDLDFIKKLPPRPQNEQLKCILAGAAFSGNKELLETLLNFPQAHFLIDSALKAAVYGNQHSTVVFLISKGAFANDAVHDAAYSNNIHLLHTFLEPEKEKSIEYAIEGATEGGHEQLTLSLLENSNTKPEHFNKAIYTAAVNNFEDLLKSLLKLKRHDDITALVRGAIKGGHDELLIKYLNNSLSDHSHLSEADYKFCMYKAIKEAILTNNPGISKDKSELVITLLEMPNAPSPGEIMTEASNKDAWEILLPLIKKFPQHKFILGGLTAQHMNEYLNNSINYCIDYFCRDPNDLLTAFFFNKDKNLLSYTSITIVTNVKTAISEFKEAEQKLYNYSADEILFYAKVKALSEYNFNYLIGHNTMHAMLSTIPSPVPDPLSDKIIEKIRNDTISAPRAKWVDEVLNKITSNRNKTPCL